MQNQNLVLHEPGCAHLPLSTVIPYFLSLFEAKHSLLFQVNQQAMGCPALQLALEIRLMHMSLTCWDLMLHLNQLIVGHVHTRMLSRSRLLAHYTNFTPASFTTALFLGSILSAKSNLVLGHQLFWTQRNIWNFEGSAMTTNLLVTPLFPTAFPTPQKGQKVQTHNAFPWGLGRSQIQQN